MAEQLTPYQKRVRKEATMRHFFTYTCNSGGLNELFKRYGLKLCPDGSVKDNGASSELLKNYLKDIVLPAIEKELGITGIQVHKKPGSLSKNLLQWYKAEIINNNN